MLSRVLGWFSFFRLRSPAWARLWKLWLGNLGSGTIGTHATFILRPYFNTFEPRYRRILGQTPGHFLLQSAGERWVLQSAGERWVLLSSFHDFPTSRQRLPTASFGFSIPAGVRLGSYIVLRVPLLAWLRLAVFRRHTTISDIHRPFGFRTCVIRSIAGPFGLRPGFRRLGGLSTSIHVDFVFVPVVSCWCVDVCS